MTPSDRPLSTSVPIRGRLEFIDGLRGLAALGVVLFHLYVGTLRRPLAAVIPRPIGALFEHGDLGVAVFFVLSGFVITHAVRGARITPAYAANFALRRQVRLDPPYWATLVFATLNIYLPWLLHPERATTLPPSSTQLLSHLVYLQNVLHRGDIVVVFWTLCIEVQFYLVFIIVLAATQRFGRGRGDQPELAAPATSTNAAHLVVVLLGLGSVVFSAFVSRQGPWFLSYWFMFVLGALTAWVAEGVLRSRVLFAFAGLSLAAGLWSGAGEPLAAAGTALAIHAAARAGRLHTWLRQSPFQYLGKISYSLYLVHYDVGFRFLNGGQKLTGDRPGWALVWFLVGLVASIAVAHLLHIAIERPSMRFAAKLRSVASPVPVVVGTAITTEE